jgi:transcriptional regulator with GAF, ATPase, and Fis domain
MDNSDGAPAPLPPRLRRTFAVQIADTEARETGLADERDEIERALVACGGNQARAAASLGWARSIFHDRAKRLGLAALVQNRARR